MSGRTILKTNTILDGKYQIDLLLGTGGFGITYAAHDIGLDATVAVKEFYPIEFAQRDTTMTVRPRSGSDKETFEHLKAAFLREAQTLIKFRHAAIVRVLSVFEAYGTAYMVMEFEQGDSFKAWLQRRGRAPDQTELDGIVQPLLDALEIVHAAGYLHRDIAPDNIIIRPDGSPVLLDFGSARHVSGSMTGIVKSGYSPAEQYATNANLQGPWTDIYALGATVYGAVTGRAPEQSLARGIEDTTAPLVKSSLTGYRADFLAGVDAAMRVLPGDRPQSIAALRSIMYPSAQPAENDDRAARRALPGAVPLVGPTAGASTFGDRDLTPGDVASAREVSQPVPRRNFPVTPLTIGAVAVLIMLGGYQFLTRRVSEPQRDTAATSTADRNPQSSAEQAYMEAMRFHDGEDVAQDYTRARALFEQAAARGHAGSMNLLGQIYRYGRGVPQSYVTAREWYERAIRTGDKDAMSNLGLLYEEGHGVPQDFGKALQWYEKAANLGNAVAMENIASLYRDGKGLALNYGQALEWHRKAAAAGQATSLNWIGRFYQKGWGLPVDLATSRIWYLKAAEAGNEDGMWNLAVLLDEGKGGSASPAQAARWLLEAAKSGHDDARTSLSGDMSSWTAATRLEVKRELRQRHSFSGALDAAWNDDVRKAVEGVLPR